VIAKLHAKNISEQQHLYLLNLREASEILVGAMPHISLMFGQYAEYSHKKIPGFICVPINFKPVDLVNYVKENIGECRKHSREYCEQIKLKQKINSLVQN